jgi:hypothetical protein
VNQEKSALLALQLLQPLVRQRQQCLKNQHKQLEAQQLAQLRAFQ